ncbi:hypothetical protein GCM10027416_07920 [Okibacterium endophyticum]
MAKKALAGVLLALVAVFTVPVAANAYVPDDEDVTVSGSVVPGGTVVVTIEDTFAPGSPVSFTVSGYGAVTIAVFKAATDSVTKTADASGTVSAAVTLPTDARGTYTVEFSGVGPNGEPIVGSIPLTVSAAGGGSGGGGGLPDTGSDLSMLGLWAGGGALLLGAALIATMTVVRRQREAQN